MLLSLRADHKDHLSILSNRSIDEIVRFCKLANDFIHHGSNENVQSLLANEIHIELDVVQNCVYGLINLLLLSCKHKVCEADFRDSLLTLGFQNEQQSILYEFYKSQANCIRSILEKQSLQDDHYNDMEWRFEVQVSSRCLQHQVNPLLTFDLSLKSGCETKRKLLQTDPTNLIHITNKLKAALMESRSTYARKVQNAFLSS